jgi:ABC transporter DrrB family efflux protein
MIATAPAPNPTQSTQTITSSTFDATIPDSGGLKWVVLDTITMVKRNLAHIRQVPEKLMNVTLQPIMFVLLFAYVFGGAIAIPGGGNYREFLMAGIFTQTISTVFGTTAIGVADDMAKGLIDRFRSLPMSPSAVLSGRAFADLIESVLGLAVLVAMGLLVGWRMHNGVLDALAALGLLLLFGFAMVWFGAVIGLYGRSTESVQVLGFILFFPIGFVSNAFVPTQSMPRILQVIAEWNPLSSTTAACRNLFGNPNPIPSDGSWPMANPELASVISSLVILAICIPIAIRRYKMATTR